MLQGIAAAAVLLDEPAYRPAVLMGLTFSIGGVDVPLAEAAASALLNNSSPGMIASLYRRSSPEACLTRPRLEDVGSANLA